MLFLYLNPKIIFILYEFSGNHTSLYKQLNHYLIYIIMMIHASISLLIKKYIKIKI